MTLENPTPHSAASEQTREKLRLLSYEFFGTTGWELMQTIFGCEVTPESRQNLNQFNDHLKQGSGVAYFNHINMADGPIIAFFLLKELSGKDGNLKLGGGPVARKHYDFTRSLWAPAFRLADLLGVEIAPVVQSYDIDSYSRTERRSLLVQYRDKAVEVLSRPGGVWAISPEETRGTDGQLQPAKDGLAELHQYGENVLFLPLAIIPKGEFNRKLKLGKIEIAAGQPYRIQEVEREGIQDGQRVVDKMMEKLSLLLPPNMRGVYP